MSQLIKELRRKFRTPQEALRALGMDEALLITPPVKTEIPMTKKTAVPSRTAIRLQAALSALAMDAKLNFASTLKGVTAKNLKARKPALVKAILAMDGMEEAMPAPATGATPDDVIMKVLEMVEGQTAAEPPEADEAPAMATEPNSAAPAASPDKAKMMEWLKAKGMSDDDMSEFDGMMGDDEDEEAEEEKAARLKKEASDKAMDEEMKKPMVSKEAMDAALADTAKSVKASVIKAQREISDAFSYVRPWVGDLANDESIEAAPDVYRKALKSLSVSGANDMHPDALKAVLDAQPKPGARPLRVDNGLAMDTAVTKSLAERFPHAASISNLG